MSTLDYALLSKAWIERAEAMRSAFLRSCLRFRECLRFAAPYINQGTNRPESPTIPVALLGQHFRILKGLNL